MKACYGILLVALTLVVGCSSREAEYQKALTLYNSESEALDRLDVRRKEIFAMREEGEARFKQILEDAKATRLNRDIDAISAIQKRTYEEIAAVHKQADEMLAELQPQIDEQQRRVDKAKTKVDKLRS